MNFQPYAVSQSQLIGTFVPEQILRGKVLDILPDRTALLELGTKKFVAKVGAVDPPLEVGRDYLFQVQKNTDPLLAKVVRRETSTRNQSSESMADDVLSSFKLEKDPLTRKMVQVFLDHGDPLTRGAVIGARSLLTGKSNFSRDILAIRWLMNKHLPLTSGFFQNAKALTEKESLSSHLSALRSALEKSGARTPTEKALAGILSRPADDRRNLSHSEEAAFQHRTAGGNNQELIQNILRQVGFGHEQSLRRQVDKGEPLTETGTLKEKLLAVLEDSSTPGLIRDLADEAIQKITGEQIQMAAADPFVAQFSLQLPIPADDGVTDVSVYWEGKRNKRGTINPDFCTILIYLNLSRLKETLVCLRVQNRALTVTIQNKSADLGDWLKRGEPMLRERLSALNYQLVSLAQVKKLDPQLVGKATQPLSFSSYRLDVKV
ncbi:hypothetical protein EWI07_02300 [Sporolactobacillus sp. THM7-4]|nr:hypothetical protein EWI07_02300 [Sporolactobacillus sp. THM7-4]